MSYTGKTTSTLVAGLMIVGALWPAGAIAGGMCSGGGVGPSMTLNSHNNVISSVTGRSALRIRSQDGKRIRLCTLRDGEPKRLTRSSMKRFRGGYVYDLALALVDCSNPERLALAKASPKRVPEALQYLNQHFRLRLRQLSPDQRLARAQGSPAMVAANTAYVQR